MVVRVIRSLSAFRMNSSRTSDSSIPCQRPISAPGANTIPSPALPSNQSAKLSIGYIFRLVMMYCCFVEVVTVEHPFVPGSTCWEAIAATLQKELPAIFAKVTVLFCVFTCSFSLYIPCFKVHIHVP